MNRGLLLAPLLLALLVGCGGSDNGDSGSQAPAADATSTTADGSSSGDEEAIREAAKAYSDAYLTGDADAAYALLSQRCQDRTDATAFASIVGAAKSQYGSALEFKTFAAEVNGDQARVTYTYDVSAIDQNQEPWVKESGDWREDDC